MVNNYEANNAGAITGTKIKHLMILVPFTSIIISWLINLTRKIAILFNKPLVYH